MSLKRKLTLGAAGALALTGAGAAVAAASGHSPGHAKTPAARSSSTSISSLLGRAGHVGRPGMGPGDDVAAAATYLGITTAQLQSDLQSGKTLAQVADATAGKSSAGLVAALVAHEKTEIAAAVTAGKLTQAQADQITANLQQRFTDMVNGTRPAGPGPGFGRPGMGPGDDFAAAATYLGITTSALQSDLQSGKTLAQVADATAGKSSAGLVAALVTHEQTEVAAGGDGREADPGAGRPDHGEPGAARDRHGQRDAAEAGRRPPRRLAGRPAAQRWSHLLGRHQRLASPTSPRAPGSKQRSHRPVRAAVHRSEWPYSVCFCLIRSPGGSRYGESGLDRRALPADKRLL